MKFWVAVLALFSIWGIIYGGRAIYVRRRREGVRSKHFPDEWEGLLERRVALYRLLPGHLKSELRKNILLFIDEKRFEGCGDLEMTDEMRLTIASQACLLVLNRPPEALLYPGLTSILVYPGPYLAPEFMSLDDNLYVETTGVQSGESWPEGMVVLAWQDVEIESKDTRRGYNVVLHEFAHQLDQESGWADGAPILKSCEQYQSWHSIFHSEFTRLREKGAGRDYPIDEYGALDPAEFFAVATETFFQTPRRLRSGVPELYEQLSEYYGVDPAEWNTS